MPLVSHDAVWVHLNHLASNSRRKLAAVAFISSDLVIKFARGDIVVTDASDDAVLAGLTSGRVLRRARDRGATVVSLERLHAKIMLFDSTLVVGSANISIRSRDRLVEAAIVTDSKELVLEASQLIERLATEGEALDDARLARLIKLESSRPKSSALARRLGEPHIIFFKQVMAGDVKKYARASAGSGTGGGARDLRVSYEFWPLLRQMLAEHGPTDGVTYGKILSRSAGARFASTDVELWRPTDSREKELRIARIYTVPGWAVDSAAYQRAASSGQNLYFVLEMDVFGTVFAKILSDRQLAAAEPFIDEHLQALARSRRPNRAIVGAVDIIRRLALPST